MVTRPPVPRRTVERRVVESLIEHHLTISTAEAASAGLVAYRISSIPGASACFVGGVVSGHAHGWPALELSSSSSPDDVATLLRERLHSNLAVCTCIISPDDGTVRVVLAGRGNSHEQVLGPWSKQPTPYHLTSRVLAILETWLTDGLVPPGQGE